MNKKILSIVLVLVVVILAGGVYAWKASSAKPAKVENSIGGTNTEIKQPEQPKVQPEQPKAPAKTGTQIEVGGVKAESETGQGSLNICLDKCGDGICQKEDKDCAGGTCVCAEAHEDCPEDCK